MTNKLKEEKTKCKRQRLMSLVILLLLIACFTETAMADDISVSANPGISAGIFPGEVETGRNWILYQFKTTVFF